MERLMESLFPWLICILVLVAAYPWSVWLIHQSPAQGAQVLPLLLTPALSIGGLTLLMFWQSVLGIHLTLAGITLPYLAVMLAGVPLWWRIRKIAAPAHLQWPTHGLARLTLICITLTSLIILLNSAYWPFYREDTMGIYAPFATEITVTGAIVPLPGEQTLYEAYPILASLAYSYAYLAAGWDHDYVASLFTTVLSIGALGASYTLGRMLFNPTAGYIAAFLLMTTPNVGRWASSGYVDLPMAFFYTMGAIFAWRLWQERHNTDAVLAGVMIGLAAWTKNAALLGILFLAGWLIWCLIWRRIRLSQALLAAGAVLIVAGPWYLRNMLIAGFLMPDTAWTDQARASLENLLILPQLYGLVGLVLTLSVLASGIEFLRRSLNAPEHALTLLWTLPFFAAWWLFASYDSRFLLMFYPILCVMAGGWLARLWPHLPQRFTRPLRVITALLIVGFTALTIWNSVEFKASILQDPLMSHEAKLDVIATEHRRPTRNR
jgi:4-amino-4-deoxy-L-arabinose transferase-like glycosyltransferase